jgi:hypothetical protein
MAITLICNDCGEALLVETSKVEKKVIELKVRPCSICITTIATKMVNNANHNLLHRLNTMADKLADEVKGEFHHKLIHNITIAIGEAKAGTPPNDGKIPITVLGEDVT